MVFTCLCIGVFQLVVCLIKTCLFNSPKNLQSFRLTLPCFDGVKLINQSISFVRENVCNLDYVCISDLCSVMEH